ncbi:peptidoglycan-binding protein [cf. Phormidesmis sp. LEGE 11477]|uniref:peptidoglycan-binding protein n=1 Tax=cf. Phormidesmis sp. LEGE 11477 TaxID=1828680 RepID=UPI00187FD654|nr:peptidoglycan-binding protein [cf. Phormidesmis sp. LEGE 11477]MBE9061512.1 HEAT repeat domain-containing protein [cf. Phormidesmis sp. LEGE 11477]
MIRRSALLLFTVATFSVLERASINIPGEMAGEMAIAQTSSILTAQSLAPLDLSIGSRDAAVSTLQSQLQARGFYEGSLDGVFSLSTQRALIAFQSEAGIESTGRLDEATRQALQTEPAAATDADPITDGEPASEPDTNEPASESPGVEVNEVNERVQDGRGLVNFLVIGLGLAAIASSFGLGFLFARRGKAKQAPFSTARKLTKANSDPNHRLGLESNQQAGSRSNHQSGSARSRSAESQLSIFDEAPFGETPTDSVNTSLGFDSPQSGQISHTRPLDPKEAVEGLIQDLHSADSQSRRRVIWELGQRGNTLAAQPLVDLMSQADSKEKSLILAALSEMGMRSLRPLSQVLSVALRDDNPEVRKNAIRDLSRIHEQVVQVSHLLGRAIDDDDSEVRQTAEWALNQLGRIRQTQDFSINGHAATSALPVADE